MPTPSLTRAAISIAADSRRSAGVSSRASTSTVMWSIRSLLVSLSWKCGATPSVTSTTSSIWVGKTFTPRMMIMSSLRPVTLSMRRNAGRAVPGRSAVRSRVRYRMTGMASLVSEVNTSSPVCPSGSTSPPAGSMISG